jgi:hypothetical protein
MSQDEDEAKRTVWAQAAAEGIIDDVLAARYSAEDQAALFRELARQALSHMPNSGDEARILARDLHVENLRQQLPFDDEPPGG